MFNDPPSGAHAVPFHIAAYTCGSVSMSPAGLPPWCVYSVHATYGFVPSSVIEMESAVEPAPGLRFSALPSSAQADPFQLFTYAVVRCGVTLFDTSRNV